MRGGAKDGVTGGLGASDMACGGCGGRCSTMSFSMGVALAMPVPGFRIGNSSSSRGFGIGMGPDMRPRTDWWPVFGLAVVGEAGALPKILAFMVLRSSVVAEVLSLRAERGKARDGMGMEEWVVVVVGRWSVDVGGDGGLSEPSGITITDLSKADTPRHASSVDPAVRSQEEDSEEAPGWCVVCVVSCGVWVCVEFEGARYSR